VPTLGGPVAPSLSGMSSRAVVAGCVAAAVALMACSPEGPELVDQESIATTTQPTQPTEAGQPPASTPPATAAAATLVPTLPFEPAAIEWEAFNDAVDVATLEVPVDYADPDGPKFDLFLARYRALDEANKIGTLLVNPGGPGFGGTSLAVTAANRFDRVLRERFDIVGWDPRGTGESDPAIDCIDDYDAYFGVDSTPADATQREALIDLAQRFTAECDARSGEILAHVGTNSSARDIDTIRRALGEQQISYFGFSYGSELGSVWSTLFPDTVRAAVFDGAVDPAATPEQSALQQIVGFQSALDEFLARCSADDGCRFHNDGDAEGAFDALLGQLDSAPIVGAEGRPPVNRDVAIGAAVYAMYSESLWPSLAQSLAAAEEGDGSGLLALWDSYYQRQVDGTWGNELEAFQVITCADTDERLTVEQADARVAAQRAAGPRLVPEGSVGSYGCTFFPPTTDPMIDVAPAANLPIVVIGTTGDASTPLASTQAMADALADGRLVVVEADQHTGYGVNRCVVDLVNAYLVDLTAPADGTECT
jgi:pimeloyl-ACP methyl ester carboxylesterase